MQGDLNAKNKFVTDVIASYEDVFELVIWLFRDYLKLKHL